MNNSEDLDRNFGSDRRSLPDAETRFGRVSKQRDGRRMGVLRAVLDPHAGGCPATRVPTAQGFQRLSLVRAGQLPLVSVAE